MTYDLTSSKHTNEQQINDKEIEVDKANISLNRPGHFKRGPKSSRKTQISLQRISQRVKKTDGCFWSGHMIYYTSINTDVCYFFINENHC